MVDIPRPGLSDGPAVRGLERAGRRSAAAIRAVTLVPTAAVALAAGLAPAAGTASPRVLTTTIVVLTLWSGAYIWLVRDRPRPRLAAADAVILSALALTAVWVVPLSWRSDGASWIVPFLAFAGVGYQYSCRRSVGIATLVALTAASVTGAVLAVPPGATTSSVVSAIWSGAIGLLAALLWALVRRGGQRADMSRSDLEDAERERDVTAAVRRDQRALLAALHDTAASTLLVVGLGDAPHDSRRLAVRARRDLTAIDGLDRGTTSSDTDLIGALATTIDVVDHPVSFRAESSPELPPAVCAALTGAVAEALANAVRHAHPSAIEVAVAGSANAVTVVVTDDGSGFDPGRTRESARGIRGSIEDRLAAVGGNARISSSPGTGTTVTLEWGHDPVDRP